MATGTEQRRGATLKFGNPSPLMQYDIPQEDGSVVRVARKAPHLEQSVTTVQFASYANDEEFADLTLSTDNDPILSMIAMALGENRSHAVAINELFQIVSAHVGGGLKPTWVSSDDQELARVAGKFFGCPVSEFAGGPELLLTSAGRDVLHSAGYNTATQPAALNYMALTANSATPLAGDTSLTGEITTASGGLIRKQATYAHTSGTNTSTLSATFTANSNDVVPVVIAKIGILNASSSGTLGHATPLSSTATISVSGDSLAVTDTVTLG